MTRVILWVGAQVIKSYEPRTYYGQIYDMENGGDDDIGELCHMFTTFSLNTLVVHTAGGTVLVIGYRKSLTVSLTVKLLRARAARYVWPC